MISAVPRAARPYQGRAAGIVTRLTAAVLDALVVLAILLLGYVLIAGLAFMVDPLAFRFPRPSIVVNLCAAIGVTIGYLTLSWVVAERTYGALVMGLRVAGPDGRRLRVTAALIRALLCVLFPVGLLWCAVSARNRSIQDMLLRTSVVYDWKG